MVALFTPTVTMRVISGVEIMLKIHLFPGKVGIFVTLIAKIMQVFSN